LPSSVWPGGERASTEDRVAVLDNSKPNADVLLGRVAELLVERAAAASIRTWRKPGASHPAANHDEIAAVADVVLTGSAD